MQAMERLTNGFQTVAGMLDRSELVPNPDRRDWARHERLISELSDTFETEVLTVFRAVDVDQLDDPDTVRGSIAAAGVHVAMVLHAAGYGDRALQLLGRVRALPPPAEELQWVTAATSDPAACARIHYAKTLLRDDRAAANAIAGQVAAEARAPAIATIAKQILNAPRELTRAPALWTLNGFGVAMYGSRDPAGDTVVKTHCVSVLFAPVMPLGAYRVVDHGDGGYGFVAREQLSAFATWYRRLVLGAAVAAVAVVLVRGYLTNPDRKAELAFGDAADIAASGDRDAAIDRYERAIARYPDADADVLGQGASALVGLYVADVPHPLAVDVVDQAVRILRRFDALPAKARTRGATDVMLHAIDEWVEDLGTESPAAIQASLSLLNEAVHIAPAGPSPHRARRRALTRALAAELSAQWPLAALDLYLELMTDAEAVAASATVVSAIAEHPALLRASGPRIRAWLDATNDNVDGAVREHVASRLAAAEQDDTARAQVIESRDAKAVVAHLHDHPRDQEVAVVRAELAFAEGDPGAAEHTLIQLGSVGWLIPDAQRMLAAIYAETDRVAEADALLTTILDLRLPRYQNASRTYWQSAEAQQERLIRRARTGDLPRGLERRLEGKSDSEQQAVFGEWLSGKLENDPQLVVLRAEYVRYADVVPLALHLGTVKLRRASAADGADKTRHLAGAERVFLAIRQDAAGLADYHLGLGQVYYRLGKPDEGEAEFQDLLERGEPVLDLQVANAYRDLGQDSRARAVATEVYAGEDKPASLHAATLMALLANDREEAETWYKRADQSDPFVKTSLLEVKARRTFDDGNYAEAERLMAKAAKAHETDAAHSPAGGNNAGLAHAFRYACTGDLAVLERSRANFDRALGLAPSSAVVVGNAASVYWSSGVVEVLDRYVKTTRLRAGFDDAEVLVSSLLAGPKREQVLSALSASPWIRKSGALTEQAIVLAPNRATVYDQSYRWAQYAQDVDRLRKLARDVDARETQFDTAAASQAREEWISGARDDKLLAQLDVAVARWRAAIERAGGHGPTLGSAQLLLGTALYRRAATTGHVDDASAAVAAYRAAIAAWPDLSRTSLAEALVLGAVLAAAAVDPAVGELWRTDGRRYSIALLLHRSPELAAAVRASGVLPEVVRIRRGRQTGIPSLADFVIGRLAGDVELETAGKAWFTDARAALIVRLDLAFGGDESRAKAVSELRAAGPR